MGSILCNNRPMRGIWGHVLWDSVKRAWFGFVFWGPYAAILMLDPLSAHSDKWVFGPFMVLTGGGMMYWQKQYPAYPVLQVLPLARATRGRIIWAQHVAVIPIASIVLWVLVSTLEVATMGGENPLLLALSLPRFIAIVAMAVGLSAIIAMSQSWYAMLLYGCASIGAFSLYVFRGRILEEIDQWYVAVTVVACGLLVAVSFLRAPYSALVRGGTGKREWSLNWPALPFVRERRRVDPLWDMMFLGPLFMVAVWAGMLLAAFILKSLITQGELSMLTMALSGMMTLTGFVGAGVVAANRAHIMRSLPLTDEQLAGLPMKFGMVGSGYATLLSCATLVAVGFADPGVIANGLLLGMCLGAFAPYIYLRLSESALFYRGHVSLIIMALILSLLFKVTWWPVLVVLAPVCLYLGHMLARKAVRDERTYRRKIVLGWRGPGDVDWARWT